MSSTKLLGVYIQDNLQRSIHVDYIEKKAASKLYLLLVLKRTTVLEKDLVKIYVTIIRPILEYACPLWHCGLTNYQSNSIEYIQQRALRIIYSHLLYEDALQETHLEKLFTRRENLSKKFFVQMQNPLNKLNHLLSEEGSYKYNFENQINICYPFVKLKDIRTVSSHTQHMFYFIFCIFIYVFDVLCSTLKVARIKLFYSILFLYFQLL